MTEQVIPTATSAINTEPTWCSVTGMWIAQRQRLTRWTLVCPHNGLAGCPQSAFAFARAWGRVRLLPGSCRTLIRGQRSEVSGQRSEESQSQGWVTDL